MSQATDEANDSMIMLYELEVSFYTSSKSEDWLGLAEKLGFKGLKWEEFNLRFASLPKEIKVGENYYVCEAHRHDEKGVEYLHWVIRYLPIISTAPPPKELVELSEKTGDIDKFFERISKNWPAKRTLSCSIQAKHLFDSKEMAPAFWPKKGLPRSKSLSCNSSTYSLIPTAQSFEVEPSIGYIESVSVFNYRKEPIVLFDTSGNTEVKMEGNIFNQILKLVENDVSCIFMARGD